LTRVYVEAELIPGSRVDLPPDTASHLAKVLRARAGDELILFNGDGRECNGAIEAVRGSQVAASVGDSRQVDRESPLSITLVQCVPLDQAQAESKATHWRAVAVNACEQCGRNRLPVIEAAQPLLNYLGESPPGAPLRLVLEPESAPLAPAPLAPVEAEIAIGPEGGFASDELEAFRVAEFSPVSLGPRVLRTETAAIAALIWLQVRFGDM
jgi:16S rRNA (uracil1498-N3)-methyltransferase